MTWTYNDLPKTHRELIYTLTIKYTDHRGVKMVDKYYSRREELDKLITKQIEEKKPWATQDGT